MTTPTKPPWKRPNPKPSGTATKLTTAQKAAARKRAKAAGRTYPNLVDNMAVAKKARSRAKTTGK